MPIMQCDLSQIEWRAAACLSQDRVMIHEINSGIDQHAEACTNPKLMNIKFISKKDPESKANRDHAKVFNFRMIYKGSHWGFYLDPNMPDFSVDRWKQIVDGFYEKYNGLKEWQDNTIKLVREQKGFLQIPTGRIFLFNKELQKDGSYDYNERKICNYPIQGISGGDILPLCSVLIRRGLIKNKLKSKLILTVHDSILFDYIKEEEMRLARLCLIIIRNLPKYISEYFNFNWNVNLDGEIEVGPNYGELKELKVEL